MRGTWYVIPAVALVAALGCGKEDRVAVYPVSGQVIYNGKPAAGVQVFFFPESAPSPPEIPANPHGVTGPDGKFTITTFTPNDGAAEGGYQVILIWPSEKPEGAEGTEDRLLGWFDIKHSRLKADIKPGSNNLPPFKLNLITKPAGEVEGVPGRN